jgi:uncharacterized protein
MQAQTRLVQIHRNGFAPAERLRPPAFHLFGTAAGSHVLMVNGSRIFSIAEDVAMALRASDDEDQAIRYFGLDAPAYIDDAAPLDPPVRSLSLAVAQKCNLACTYCYAQQGDFGNVPKDMSTEVADRSVDLLFSSVRSGERVQLTFLGGEPLTNRGVLRRATERAAILAARSGTEVRFSVTTNGTLLTPEDGEFFERHGFAVTISLDGPAEAHDALRPSKGGAPTFDRVMSRVLPLLRLQRRMQVSARVTVTPLNLSLRETLDGFLNAGFHSVGFSPLLSSGSGQAEMSGQELETMLAGMVACGEEFERRILRGERYSFLNMTNAMQQLHKGTHRPYPCGAGAGYFGVSADGELYACHRFVEDPDGHMGDIDSGPDRARQRTWLTERHVHRQEPCRSCWARYLCGGGCHHETIRRGRPACDYIRGWLDYCLRAYVRLLHARPEYFAA